MANAIKVDDHVTWDSADDHIRGKVVKVHHDDVTFMGRTYHGSGDDPIYEVESDKTGHHAMHKADALKPVGA